VFVLIVAFLAVVAVDAGGGPGPQDSSEAHEAALRQLSSRQVAAVLALGRLLAFRCLPEEGAQWLGGKMVPLLIGENAEVGRGGGGGRPGGGGDRVFCG
jgi:hypothetical protein